MLQSQPPAGSSGNVQQGAKPPAQLSTRWGGANQKPKGLLLSPLCKHQRFPRAFPRPHHERLPRGVEGAGARRRRARFPTSPPETKENQILLTRDGGGHQSPNPAVSVLLPLVDVPQNAEGKPVVITLLSPRGACAARSLLSQRRPRAPCTRVSLPGAAATKKINKKSAFWSAPSSAKCPLCYFSSQQVKGQLGSLAPSPCCCQPRALRSPGQSPASRPGLTPDRRGKGNWPRSAGRGAGRMGFAASPHQAEANLGLMLPGKCHGVVKGGERLHPGSAARL